MKLRHFSVALAVGVFALAGEAWARSQVQVVGASETYPLTKAVADAFSAGGAFPEPDIRSTGSGGGIKQFCGGVGAATPDVVSTIRPMRDQEKAQCEANGVDVGALTEGDQPIGLINEKPVFVYFKPAHVGVVKGLREFLAAFRSAAGDAKSNSGVLIDAGMAPPPPPPPPPTATASSGGSFISYNSRERPGRWTDCDDNDASVRPGQVEVCNGKDDDCDGTIDDNASMRVYEDKDRDGFGDARRMLTVCLPGYPTDQISLRAGDCDDSDPSKTPISGCE